MPVWNRRNTDGTGEYLKSQNPDVKVIAMSLQLLRCFPRVRGGAHKIQGIGAGFVPDVLNTKIYDEVVTVENDDAFAGAKLLAKKRGYPGRYLLRCSPSGSY